MSESIASKIQEIKQRINNACEKAGRDPEEVQLLLATKTVTPERILEAFETGETLIAENKIQEVEEKAEGLANHPHTAHFIGHLQTNKVKFLIKNKVRCLHSLDRMRLAQRLQNRLEFEDEHMDVLIQVNTSAEQSKFGLKPEEVIDFVKEVAQMDRLHIKGLMTIGLFSADLDKVRVCFQKLRGLKESIIAENIPGVEMKELSMGMSNDLEVAIEEGATIIRVGTAVFGKREYSDAYYWPE